MSITACPIPDGALLDKYRDDESAYADCFSTAVSGSVPLGSFVVAFYTTWLFRLERVVLKHLAGKPSSDRDARRLADGDADTFAAWQVEDRSAHELLMCDFRGRTRSWFRVAPVESATGPRTLLQFGSAVVPRPGKPVIGRGYRALLGLHRAYSRLLLGAARARLEKLRSDRD